MFPQAAQGEINTLCQQHNDCQLRLVHDLSNYPKAKALGQVFFDTGFVQLKENQLRLVELAMVPVSAASQQTKDSFAPKPDAAAAGLPLDTLQNLYARATTFEVEHMDRRLKDWDRVTLPGFCFPALRLTLARRSRRARRRGMGGLPPAPSAGPQTSGEWGAGPGGRAGCCPHHHHSPHPSLRIDLHEALAERSSLKEFIYNHLDPIKFKKKCT